MGLSKVVTRVQHHRYPEFVRMFLAFSVLTGITFTIIQYSPSTSEDNIPKGDDTLLYIYTSIALNAALLLLNYFVPRTKMYATFLIVLYSVALAFNVLAAEKVYIQVPSNQSEVQYQMAQIFTALGVVACGTALIVAIVEIIN